MRKKKNYRRKSGVEFILYDRGADGMATAVLQDGDEVMVILKEKNLSELSKAVGPFKKANGYWGYPQKVMKGQAADPSWKDSGNPGETVKAESVDSIHTFSINRRFEMTQKIVQLMVKGYHSAAIVTGQGGTGKSYTVFSTLDTTGIEYERISGHVAMSGLYEVLHRNKDEDSFVVFDDADSVFANETTINWLKAVLDTTQNRVVSWESSYPVDKLDLPRSFSYEGKILFITNRTINKIPQSILSRSTILNLEFTQEELIERMRFIAPKMYEFRDMDSEIVKETIDFLDLYKNNFKDLSLRSLIKALRFRASGEEDWQDLVRFTL